MTWSLVEYGARKWWFRTLGGVEVGCLGSRVLLRKEARHPGIHIHNLETIFLGFSF